MIIAGSFGTWIMARFSSSLIQDPRIVQLQASDSPLPYNFGVDEVISIVVISLQLTIWMFATMLALKILAYIFKD